MSKADTNYLELISKDYPTIQAVSSEIINLQAILNLPKATEHFVSDLHGEHEAFLHVLKNASGVIKSKIDIMYSTTLSEIDRRQLATLIYYPKEKLYHLSHTGELTQEWYKMTLYRLVEMCRIVASKYTRSKVRKAMPQEYSYIIEELLHTPVDENNKRDYYIQIIQSIIYIGNADEFIIAIANLIRRLSIDHLHVLGDVFDRGPRADIIMDELYHYHTIDMQWGNHDIEWIGAASGNLACIANVIRNSLRYNNFDVLEVGYGINTRPLANFAMETYADDKCERFMPLDSRKRTINSHKAYLAAKMHKAITIIQFKLEGQLICRHPEYEMENRCFLDKIIPDEGMVKINDKLYPLTDTHFPTIDFSDPYKFTKEEDEVISSLKNSFLHSEKLQQHIGFMVNNGGMYKIYNGNLMFHGCIPLTEDGNFELTNFFGKDIYGKEYLDTAERYVRETYLSRNNIHNDSDFLWYLWCGSKSPLYGKDILTTFEGYFIDEKTLLQENKNSYYKYIESADTCSMIFDEFGLDPSVGHIINGHVPVKRGKGESPIKANGLLYVIDGGFSKPYQETTGIAGYTLINNSYGYSITEHQPFMGVLDVIENDSDLHSDKIMVEQYITRKKVKDTDTGTDILNKISVLTELLNAYRTGKLSEKG